MLSLVIFHFISNEVAKLHWWVSFTRTIVSSKFHRCPWSSGLCKVKKMLSWMFVSPPPHREINSWSSDPQCDDIWMWGRWQIIRFTWDRKGEVPIMRLVFLEEEETKVYSLFLPCEDAGCTQTRRRALTRNWSSTLVSGCPTSRTMCKYISVVKPVYRILLKQPELSKTVNNRTIWKSSKLALK